MDHIELPRPAVDGLARLPKKKLGDSVRVDIGQFEVIDLVDYMANTMGPQFYNQGLQDAQALCRKKFEEIVESVIEIEMPLKI